MLECLIDYIGIRVCEDDPIPESELYINTLPGISLESIDKIATADQITYKGVWEDVQAEAAPRFKLDFKTALSECYTLSRHCDYGDLICENLEHLANAWRYLLGNQMMIFRLNTTRLNRFTTVDKESAEKLRDFYQVEYEKFLLLAVKFVDVSGCCEMECSNNPERVIWLP